MIGPLETSCLIISETFCPKNWIYIGRRCIGIVSDKRETFDNANSICHKYGADLLTLHYTKELRIIMKRLSSGK